MFDPVINRDLSEVVMIDETRGWILADDLLLRYENKSWQEVIPPTGYDSFTAMGVVNADEVWVMNSEALLRYKAGEWEIFDNPIGVGLGAIVMLNENEGWAVGGGILHYTSK